MLGFRPRRSLPPTFGGRLADVWSTFGQGLVNVSRRFGQHLGEEANHLSATFSRKRFKTLVSPESTVLQRFWPLPFVLLRPAHVRGRAGEMFSPKGLLPIPPPGRAETADSNRPAGRNKPHPAFPGPPAGGTCPESRIIYTVSPRICSEFLESPPDSSG